jgi:hypothetical protein
MWSTVVFLYFQALKHAHVKILCGYKRCEGSTKSNCNSVRSMPITGPYWLSQCILLSSPHCIHCVQNKMGFFAPQNRRCSKQHILWPDFLWFDNESYSRSTDKVVTYFLINNFLCCRRMIFVIESSEKAGAKCVVLSTEDFLKWKKSYFILDTICVFINHSEIFTTCSSTLKGNSSLGRSSLERPKNRFFWSQKIPWPRFDFKNVVRL